MFTSLEQIQLFYEISMAIGTSLDLKTMIKTALSAYLKKLNCAAGAVFRFTENTDGNYHFQKIYSIPRNIELVKSYKEAFNIWKLKGPMEEYGEAMEKLPYSPPESLCCQSSYIMDLPDFGILFLSTNREHFSDQIVHSIAQLNCKLAKACVACLQNGSLKKSEEKYRSIFEESQDIIFIRTIQGKFIDINPAGLRIFGYSSFQEIKKLDISEDLFQNASDFKIYNRILRKKGFVTQYEHLLKRKDGHPLIVVENSTAIYDADHNVIACRGTISDITDKKKLEAQLIQSQKMECIGTLAGGVAHDFNNLLTVINGYSEMALMDVTPENPIYNNIISISEAGQQASKLTSQLLAISRKQVYNVEPLNINTIIYSLNNIVKRLIDEDIKIDIHLVKDLPNIKGDKTQLEQIFLNLLVNSRDALRNMKKKRNTKTIKIESGQFYIDSEWAATHPGCETGQHVFFSVSDNGDGMKEEIRQKIFEPFFTTKDKNTGTGLGLSVVYGIIKQNSAFIDVQSDPYWGTMFKVYWPATREAQLADMSMNENGALTGDETILVVEDEEEVCRFTCDALTKKGYHVYAAKNGLEALQLIQDKTSAYDLVVTDLIMPELGGLEFIERAKSIAPGINAIYVSGYVDKHIVKNAMFEEGINFIQKPYSVSSLVKAVRAMLDNAKKA